MSTSDPQETSPNTDICCYKSEPTWDEEEERVQSFFSESQATINIYITLVHRLITRDDPPVLLRQTLDSTLLSTSKLGYEELLLDYHMVDDFHVESNLDNCNQIPAEQSHQLKQHIKLPEVNQKLNQGIKSACDSLADTISKEKLKEISIAFEFRVVSTEFCDMQDFIDQQADHIKLVPAAPSAVEALKTKKCDEENFKDQCTICKEEFLTGEDVTLMPCSHIYHKECIGCWLKTTNTCPLCRFAMPTANKLEYEGSC